MRVAASFLQHAFRSARGPGGQLRKYERIQGISNVAPSPNFHVDTHMVDRFDHANAIVVNSNREFYKRDLPDTCIPFTSAEGKRLFAEALQDGTLECYFPLAAQFRTQDEPAYCGLTTLVMVLNTLSIDPRRLWKGPWRWFSEEMVGLLQPCVFTCVCVRDLCSCAARLLSSLAGH
jgi:hypothetical protein